MAEVQHFSGEFAFSQTLSLALGGLNLLDIADATANGFSVQSSFGGSVDKRAEIIGQNLTFADGNLTGGTITAFSSFVPSLVSDDLLDGVTVTGLSLDATVFQQVFESIGGATTVLNAMLAGRDTVNGSADKDEIVGQGGADILRGQAEDDSLFGGDGGDSLFGGAGNDRLTGGKGNDHLSGGAGADILQGSQGRDVFVFDTALGASNIDTHQGTYRKRDDAIHLDRDVFEGIGGLGQLEDDAFVLGRRALDDEDRIIYDRRPGLNEARLLFDADGAGGDAAQVFLRIQLHQGRFPSLDASEFIVI